MKTKNIFLFAFLLIAGVLFSQSPGTPDIQFQAAFRITNATNGTGDTVVISGYVDECAGRFTNSDIAIGDSIYVLEGSDLLVFGAVTTRSISLGIATFKAIDFGGAGILPSNGQAAIFRPTTNYQFPGDICGLNPNLQQYITARFMMRLDEFLNEKIDSTTLADSLLVIRDSLFEIRNDIGTGGASIDSVIVADDYDALRGYTGDAEAVIVKDFTYTFNSISYTTIGGVFYRTASGTENGGTLIVADNAVKWKRVWDESRVYPEWWEVGGKDYAGNDYVNKNTSTYGIYDESDRIISASMTNGTNVVVVLKAGKTYTVTRSLGLGYYEGNNATIQRDSTVLTPLTGDAGSGSTTVDVADASSFRVGDFVVIQDVSATNGGVAYLESNYSAGGSMTAIYIKSISGNTITLTSALTTSMVTGDLFTTVNTTFSTLVQVIDGGTVYTNLPFFGKVRIRDVTIDEARPDTLTVDWRFGKCIVGFTDSTSAIVLENVHFKNMRSGCVTGRNINLTNFSAINIPTSLVHQSSVLPTDYNYVRVSNGKINNIGYLSHLAAHDEAVLTHSANSTNTSIKDVIIHDMYNNIVGTISLADDYTLKVDEVNCYGKYVSGVKKVILYAATSSGATAQPTSNITISNSFFENCGDIVIFGRGASSSPNINLNGAKFIKFNDNDFINTRIQCTEGSFIDVVNNKFITRTNYNTFIDYDDYSNAAISATNGRSSFLAFMNCDRLNIVNNRIEGDSLYNYWADTGISIEHGSSVFMKFNGTDTEQYYHQNIHVNGNTIINVTRGITMVSRWGDSGGSWFSPPVTGYHVDWQFNDNIIHLEKYTQYPDNATRQQWAIFAAAGVEVNRNTIYMPEDPVDGTPTGITVAGFVAASALKARWPGAIVTHNTIYNTRSEEAITCSFTGAGATYNNYIAYNNYQGTLTNMTNSFVTQNEDFSVSNFPAMTTPTHIKARIWLQDNGDY